mmetsp:Transcript_36993/g.119333  ORF Transcript_36993/g.119333 Transcript_36993/m.119333 type:complete len:162 (+) Transcript_36993:69-554(+)
MGDAMPLLQCVEEKQHMRVLKMIQNGADPNGNYLGVSPLSMAVEGLDVDMVALLIEWKADPLMTHRMQAPSALDLAEKLAKDGSATQQAPAAEMVQLMTDPEVVKARLKSIESMLLEQQAADQKKARVFVFVACVSAAALTIFYKYVVAAIPNEGPHGGDL